MEETFYLRSRGRIQGPYDRQRMRAMVRRGLLSRMHEISTDGQTWRRASEYPEFFEVDETAFVHRRSPGFAEPADPPTEESPGLDPREAASAKAEPAEAIANPEPENPALKASWHYSHRGERAGPIVGAMLQSMLDDGQLAGDTLVWSSGMTEWQPAWQAPGLRASAPGAGGQRASASRQRNLWWAAVAGVAAVCLVLAVGAGWAAFQTFRDTTLATPDNNNGQLRNSSGLVTGVFGHENEQQVSQAVGMVCCGWSAVSHAGEVSEIACLWHPLFIVTKDGRGARNMTPIKGKLDVPDYVEKYITKDQSKLAEFLTTVPFKENVDVIAETLLGSTGTCFMISPDGYAITNEHVVEELYKTLHARPKIELLRESVFAQYAKLEPTIWVFFDGEPYKAEIIHVSDEFDMCILHINRPSGPFFPLSDSHQLARGTELLTLGFPGAVRQPLPGYEDEPQGGHERSIKHEFKPSDFSYHQEAGALGQVTQRAGSIHVIMHSAKINSGNSGGPLVNQDGVVVGVNTWGSGMDVNISQAMPQLRREIDRHVPSAVWVSPSGNDD